VKRIQLWLQMLWYAPIRLIPVGAAGPMIRADVERWGEILQLAGSPGQLTLKLLASHPEFRTLYYYRLRRAGSVSAALAGVAAIFWPGERTLHLACSEIGPGLFIQHGFATIIAARRLGANCWVNQQVTIGFTQQDQRPVLGDNVFVYAGAKVFGDITIGDGATVGANAVVLTDVPPQYTAVGVPARLLPPKEPDHS
jgi:serine O-acetyltransferase